MYYMERYIHFFSDCTVMYSFANNNDCQIKEDTTCIEKKAQTHWVSFHHISPEINIPISISFILQRSANLSMVQGNGYFCCSVSNYSLMIVYGN